MTVKIGQLGLLSGIPNGLSNAFPPIAAPTQTIDASTPTVDDTGATIDEASGSSVAPVTVDASESDSQAVAPISQDVTPVAGTNRMTIIAAAFESGQAATVFTTATWNAAPFTLLGQAAIFFDTNVAQCRLGIFYMLDASMPGALSEITVNASDTVADDIAIQIIQVSGVAQQAPVDFQTATAVAPSQGSTANDPTLTITSPANNSLVMSFAASDSSVGGINVAGDLTQTIKFADGDDFSLVTGTAPAAASVDAGATNIGHIIGTVIASLVLERA